MIAILKDGFPYGYTDDSTMRAEALLIVVIFQGVTRFSHSVDITMRGKLAVWWFGLGA